MKNATIIGAVVGVVVVATAALFFEAWLLGVILSWFGVSLTFWQNLLIILLANAIFKNTGSSN
jgi:hypothetical protein